MEAKPLETIPEEPATTINSKKKPWPCCFW